MTTTTIRQGGVAERGAFKFSEARLSTGVRLRYAEQGSTEGQPVIFLHGYSDSWFSFSRVLPHFCNAYRLFALDQRGHGDSEQPQGGYAVTDFADDVIAFMDAMNIKSAVVVGHSMGSLIARHVAYAAPERVTKLVLVGAVATLRNEAGFELQAAVEALTDPVPATFAREFQESTVYQPLPESFMERAVAESLKLPARVWREIMRGMMEADDAAQLGNISAPTLLLWGERDAFFLRDQQEALVRAIPNARLKVYEETGHALH
jgi:pimeloyl-ACP methyl ester carboxylesterase